MRQRRHNKSSRVFDTEDRESAVVKGCNSKSKETAMNAKKFSIVTHGDSGQSERRNDMLKLFKECPIPENEMLLNMGLFLVPQTLSRILFLDFLYRQILPVQGVVFDLGTRWGQNLSLFTTLRGIYEPFNRLRKIVAFDTFEGFKGFDTQDGKGRMMVEKG